MGWAAAVPWIASAVGALASMYGAKQASKAQNQVADQQGQLVALQREAANRLMPWGEGLMKQGAAALTSQLPWYTKAAYGDRNVLQQLMAPELRSIRQNFDVPQQQLGELTPRGGTTSAGNVEILTRRGEALSNALLSARLAGLSGLSDIGGKLASLGAGATGAAFGGLSGAAAGNQGLLASLYNIRQQNTDASSAVGSSIVDFLRWYANRPTTTTTPAATPAATPTMGTYGGPSSPSAASGWVW